MRPKQKNSKASAERVVKDTLMGLTAVAIKAAKGRNKQYKLADADGLYLLVLPTGRRYWRMNYRFHGKFKTIAFGVWPEVKLSDARTKKDAARQCLANGIDPAEQQKLDRIAASVAAANTFRAVADEWIDKIEQEGRSPVTLKKIVGCLVLPTMHWVFDANNYSQNLMQAARALQQINQKIGQLQNEATMIAQGTKNLESIDFPQLRELNETLQTIDRLMGEAQGIDFNVAELDQKFRDLYPGNSDRAVNTNQSLLDAKARINQAMQAYRQTMKVQEQVTENVKSDAEILSAVVARSQGAQGNLLAQQATNQLLALTAK